MNIFESVKRRYVNAAKKKYFWLSLVASFIFLFGSIFVIILAIQYNDGFIYPSIGDSLLDYLPTYNLEFLYVWGIYILLGVIFIYSLLFLPERIPFILKTYAILFLVRGIFILLTNYGPPYGNFYSDGVVPINHLMRKFLFKNDLFFSGHVSTSFLAFLLVRGTNKFVELFLLIGSFVMAVTVLLMHVHYSIDVFAAFFITYGVYAVSDEVFGRLNERFFGWRGFHYENAGDEMTIKITDKKDK